MKFAMGTSGYVGSIGPPTAQDVDEDVEIINHLAGRCEEDRLGGHQ